MAPRINRPLEVDVLRARLLTQFTGKIPEATQGDQEERERNFLSRALAAYALTILAACESDVAAASIVDGGEDGGIDAVHFTTDGTLWLIQSKFIADGRGQAELGEVGKFLHGVDALLADNQAHFNRNASWRPLLPILSRKIAEGGIQVKAVVVYSGISLLADDRCRLANMLERKHNHEDEYLSFHSFNLATIGDWLADAHKSPGVASVELEVFNPGWVRAPYETLYGQVPIATLAGLFETHKHRIVAANIRRYLGDSDVNEVIHETAINRPSHFFYLNNGLTAYCDRISIDGRDRANHEKKRIVAHGFSIINGAQTLGAIHAATADSDSAPVGFVFIKIISLAGCEDGEDFARRITQSSNLQNRIEVRDFVSMDEVQSRIAERLSLVGVNYHYKSSGEASSPDASNFTLTEATTALAAHLQENSCDLLSRIIAQRHVLWSMEPVFHEEPKDRYRRIFSEDCDPRKTWRAVQVQRVVIKKLSEEGRASNGPRKAFFENSRWLVLNIIFLKHHPQDGDDILLSEDEAGNLASKAGEYSEALWRVCELQGFVGRDATTGAFNMNKHFKSIFSNPEDCRRLRGGVLAELARTAQQQVAVQVTA